LVERWVSDRRGPGRNPQPASRATAVADEVGDQVGAEPLAAAGRVGPGGVIGHRQPSPSPAADGVGWSARRGVRDRPGGGRRELRGRRCDAGRGRPGG
jgi:hypothetical protein